MTLKSPRSSTGNPMLDSSHGRCAEDSARYSSRCVARHRTSAGIDIPCLTLLHLRFRFRQKYFSEWRELVSDESAPEARETLRLIPRATQRRQIDQKTGAESQSPRVAKLRRSSPKR